MTDAARRPAATPRAPAIGPPAAPTPRAAPPGEDAATPRATPAAEADRALVARMLAGDQTAFGDLVDGLHGRAVTFAEGLLRDRSMAEDAVQETWLAVVANLRQWEGRSTLRTWIYAILVNQVRKSARRKGRELLLSDLSPGDDGEDTAAIADTGRVPWMASSGRAAGEGLDSRDRLAALEEAVNSLPPAQRAVLVLSDIEGLDGDSVCNVLGLSRINRRVLLHRARTRIRTALKHRFGGTDS